MALTLYCNPNPLDLNAIDFGDLNNFDTGFEANDGTYWHTLQSTPIDADIVYNYMISMGYGVPKYVFSTENVANAYNGSQEIFDSLSNDYFWLVGSFEDGFGVFFGLDGQTNKISLNGFAWDGTNMHSYGINVDTKISTSDGTQNNILYIVDQIYYKGTITTGTCFLNGKYNVTVQYSDVHEWYYRNNIDDVAINDTDTQWANAVTRKVPYFTGYNVTYSDWIEYARNSEYISKHDPYKPTGGDTKPDGGNGEIRVSVDVDHPSAPPDMLLKSGIVKIYKPTETQLNDFINWIYSRPLDIVTNIKKMWVEPMQSIISMGILPFDVPTSESTEIVKFCGVSTNVAMSQVKSQYIEMYFGDNELSEESNTFLDYANYTEIKCYLPFIGIVSLSTNDCMRAIINLKYIIDIFTGDCIASIKCTKKVGKPYNIDYSSALYEFKGNVLAQTPLTGNNYQQLYNGVLGLANSIMLPTSVGDVKNAISSVGQFVTSQKVSVNRSGSLVGNSGHLGIYVPYLIVESPIASTTDSMYEFQGMPYNRNKQLKSLIGTGLTIVQSNTLRLNDIECTEEEQREIIELFETGVVL